MIRFVHCSDLHLGSAFLGLSRADAALAAELADAPFKTLKKIVAETIAFGADFLLIAGDVFDRTPPAWNTRQRFSDALIPLRDMGIRVFIAPGNHDPAPGWDNTVPLPENVTVFPGGRAVVIPIHRAGKIIARVAGAGHATGEDRGNPTPLFAAALPNDGVFTAALLHADIDGAPDITPYAPAPLHELCALPVQYWALGHVHQYRELSNVPRAVYSGCPQGRSIHEPGPRGAVFVIVDDAGGVTTRFESMEEFRFEELTLDRLAEIDSLPALKRQLSTAVEQLNAPGKLLLRLRLAGPSPLHAALRRQTGGELTELLSAGCPHGCRIESLELQTVPPRSPEELAGPAAEVALALKELQECDWFETRCAALRKSARELPPLSREELAAVGPEAAARLIDYLTGVLNP